MQGYNVKEHMNKCKNEWMNEWVTEWMMKERENEWTIERLFS
jgi:hypothetical protein